MYVSEAARRKEIRSGWCVYLSVDGKDTMVADSLNENDARQLARNLNQKLNEEEGIPRTQRFPFYFAQHGNAQPSPFFHGLDVWIDEDKQ
jgi:hypothetical protein